MRIYKNSSTEFESDDSAPPWVKRMFNKVFKQQRRLEVFVRQRVRDSGRVPISMTGDPCGGGYSVCADNVSKQTKLAVIAGNRTSLYTADLNALAPNTPVTLVHDPSEGGNVFTGSGMWRTVYLTDLVSALTSVLPATGLDAIRVKVFVGGIQRMSFAGGRFARSNANDCSTACGLYVCAGPQETISVTVTNVTGAAFAATPIPTTLETRTVYQGEEGFMCGADGSCVPQSDEHGADGGGSCESCGGEEVG